MALFPPGYFKTGYFSPGYFGASSGGSSSAGVYMDYDIGAPVTDIDAVGADRYSLITGAQVNVYIPFAAKDIASGDAVTGDDLPVVKAGIQPLTFPPASGPFAGTWLDTAPLTAQDGTEYVVFTSPPSAKGLYQVPLQIGGQEYPPAPGFLSVIDG